MDDPHLSNEDIARLLALDLRRDAIDPLEHHTVTCDACADWLAHEAQIELLCIEAGERRRTRRKSRIRRGVAGMAAMTITLAILIVLREREHPVALQAKADPVMVPSSARSEFEPWRLSGSTPKHYRVNIELDPTVPYGNIRTLRYAGPYPVDPNWFGTLMQKFSAEKYRGKRVLFSAQVKTSDVTMGALWMRVDGQMSHLQREPEILAFDNMDDRPIRGTTPWTRYEVVLDVPREAASIALGFLVNGDGMAWFAEPQFEIVGDQVPVTRSRVQQQILPPDFRR